MRLSEKEKKISKKEYWLDKLNNYFCPIFLSTAIVFSIIYILCEKVAVPYTVLAMFAEIGLFLFFDKIKKYPALGAIVYTLLFIVIMSYSVRQVFRGAWSGYPNPVDWFYGEENIEPYQPLYLRALFLGGGFFVSSVLYYFTQVRYRSLGAMLCTLFPFVYYAKRGDEMPAILITLIITLFLAVMIHNRRIDPAKDAKKLGRLKVDRAYIISFAIFISLTGALAMSIKKPTFRSKLEKSADFFDNLLFTGATSGYENTSRNSSTRKGGFGYISTPLFYLEDDGEQMQYFLRRQVFDRFNGSVWETTGGNYWSAVPYSSESPEYSTDDILLDMESIAANDDEVKAPDISAMLETKSIKVYDKSFKSTYLPAPFNTVTDTEPSYAIKYFKYPPASVVYRVRAWYQQPTELNDTYEFINVTRDAYAYAADLGLSSDDYTKLLRRNLGNDAVLRLSSDYMAAVEGYTDQSGISDRVRQLAEEVTQNCHSDIEKALALESYFTSNGYKYSTEYVPKDNSIDYFLFESKTGYCAGYATAMTLMARAVGLPARYVEGFAAFERTDSGAMIIREGHAHAFVEVYIPAVGWLTFDPTVSDYLHPTGGNGNNGADLLFYLIFMLSRFFIVIIVAFIVVFVLLLDRIREVLFRLVLCFVPVRKRVLMLYSNLIKLVNFSTKDDYSAYTVKMLRAYLTDSRGAVPEKLLALFEKTAFGGYDPSAAEYGEAYAEYKKCYKYLRKIPKGKKTPKTA